MSCEYDTDLIFHAKEIVDPCDKTALHEDVERRLDIDALINKLPDKKRAVANFCREGMSQAEIASRMKISRGRVCQILQEIGLAIGGEL